MKQNLDLSKLWEMPASPAAKTPGKDKPAAAAYSPLQKEADLIKSERERAMKVYKDQLENIRVSEELQAEILKDVKINGEDAQKILLKACKVISLMTGNNVFYEQIYDDLKKAYGIK